MYSEHSLMRTESLCQQNLMVVDIIGSATSSEATFRALDTDVNELCRWLTPLAEIESFHLAWICRLEEPSAISERETASFGKRLTKLCLPAKAQSEEPPKQLDPSRSALGACRIR